jgi:GntR family transcriptional regulator/MocR family aminotransferase
MATMLSPRPCETERAPAVSRIRRVPALILGAGDGRLHAKLYHGLRDLIEGGNWSPGMRLPSSRVLAEDLGVSRNTASIALEHLVAEGWAEARSRSGIFVARRLPRRASPPAPLRSPDEARPAPAVPDVPVDLFPLRHWRSIHARLWAAHGHRLLDVAEAGGEACLRRSIARLVCAARGFDADPDTIVIASGVGPAIGAIAAALGGPDPQALISDPECPSVAAGLRLHGVGTRPLRDRGEAATAIVSAALHVPAGSTLGAAARRALLQWAGEERWIIERDCSGWAASAEGRPVAPLRADPMARRVIYVRGFDDVLFPGLPLCFVVAPPELTIAIKAALARETAHAGKADQLAFRTFIDEGYLAAHLRCLKRALPERRDRLKLMLRRHVGADLRIDPQPLPRHLVIRTKQGASDRLAAMLGQAGLPLRMIDEQGTMLVGFGGLTDAAGRQVEARLRL